jgi:hypothetical protein
MKEPKFVIVDVTYRFPEASRIFGYFEKRYEGSSSVYPFRLVRKGYERYEHDHRPIKDILAEI